MASGTSVQFFGRDKVLQAYRARGIDSWSIWQGKDFMHCGDSDADLDAYLKMLQGSAGVYQLRVHRDVSTEEIDSSTPFHGSFRFKLDGGAGGAVGGLTQYSPPAMGAIDLVNQKVQQIVADKIGKILDRWDEEEKPEPWYQKLAGGMLDAISKDPSQLPQMIGAIRSLFLPGAMQPMPVMGNVTRVGEIVEPSLTDAPEETELSPAQEKEANDLFLVYDRLKKHDPLILTHLQKLARIAEKKPDTFQMLLQTLNNMHS